MISPIGGKRDFFQGSFFAQLDSSALALFHALGSLPFVDFQKAEETLQNTFPSPVDNFFSPPLHRSEPFEKVIQQHRSPLSDVSLQGFGNEGVDGGNLTPASLEVGRISLPQDVQELDDFLYKDRLKKSGNIEGREGNSGNDNFIYFQEDNFIVRDTTAPVPTLTLDSNITPDDIINVAESGGVVVITGSVGGEAQIGDTVTLSINGGSYTGSVLVGHVFSIPVLGSDLVADPDSVIDASISTLDLAGNIGVALDTQGYSVDVIAPNAPVVVSISSDTGSSGVDGVTSDNTLLINGTSESNSTVEVFLDGVSLGTVLADGFGSWSFNHRGTTLVDGSYIVTASATDVAGNPGPLSAGFSVSIDTAAPVVHLTLDDNILSLNAPDHTFETSASRNYFDISASNQVRTTTAMSFNNGQNVRFNASAATDVFANEGTQMLGMRARGRFQAQIETDLGVASGIFDSIDPDGAGPKGPLNVTDGSYAQTVLYAKAGDVIKFDWNFLGPETMAREGNRNDAAFVVINGVITELSRSTDVVGPAASGWQTFTYTAIEEGPVEFSFALFNVQNRAVDSGFSLDNFRINDAPVQKQPVELNINLTVTDETAISSSDVLITISGVDLTSVLSAGINRGGGIWELSVSDLEGLTMTPPDASSPGYTGTETLTIMVQATDSAGNMTTVSDTQNIQFEILDNTIMGTNANNTINGSNGTDDYLSGRDGNDLLRGRRGDDFLDGGPGNDDLRGQNGRDILLGGTGNDILRGGNGDDVFMWIGGDEGTVVTPATDIIVDFSNSLFSGVEDDKIDLSDLLSGESYDTLTDYLFIEFSGGDSTIYINTTGAIDGSATHNADQVIVVENIDLTGGTATQSAIIDNLIQNNVIVTDSADSVSII